MNSLSTAIIHLVGPGKLKIHNGRLAFSTGEGSPAEFDLAALRHVVCYGDVGITDQAVRAIFRAGARVSWLSGSGNRLQGRMQGSDDAGCPLRLRQYELSCQPAARLAIARWLVAEKIRSQRNGARHFQRHGSTAAARTLAGLDQRLAQVDQTGSLDELRGVEGQSTHEWFRLVADVLLPPWTFAQRNRRPPRDPVNALLSFGYTCLLNKVSARVQAEGFEVQLGTLHDYRAGRPSLACDLQEPLRATVVDRCMVAICNQERLTPEDFRWQDDEHGLRLEPPRVRDVVGWFEEHWLRMRGADLLEELVREYGRQLNAAAKP